VAVYELERACRMTFEDYDTESFYDEMFLPDGSPRPEARRLVERIESLPDGELVRRHQAAERSLLHTGSPSCGWHGYGPLRRIP